MDAIRIDYAGMNAGAIIAWILIATAAGLIARSIVRGRKLMGLWGDMAIGLIGIFLVGTLFRAFHLDLSVWLKSIEPDWQFDFAIWIDVTVSALLGALLLRLILRPLTGGK
ncbi:MAG: hypothetical protein GC155_16720 [Alphaproteobacteria bacterium]|nr:hypothetical protein [Alphaproteobacteria bacterium]